MNRPEHHRISCPYCQVGYGLYTVSRNGSGELKGDLTQHPKCVACERHFRVIVRVTFVGKPLAYSGPLKLDLSKVIGA